MAAGREPVDLPRRSGCGRGARWGTVEAMIVRTLRSGFRVLTPLGPFSQATIRDEPTFSVIPTEAARAEGGPIHRAFIDALPPEAQSGTLLGSTRLWLRAGWLPGARGLHLDQHETASDNQTDYRKPRFPGQPFYMLCAGVSRTRFVLGDVPLPDHGPGERRSLLLRQLAADLEARGAVTSKRVPDSTLVAFDNDSIHETSPAEADGWRILVRVFPMRPVRLDYDADTLRALRVVLNDPVATTEVEQTLLREM